MEQIVHILHIKDDLNGGAALINYRFAKLLKGRCVYDWLLTNTNEEFGTETGTLEEAFLELGGQVYHLPPSDGTLQRVMTFYRFFKAHNVKTVHFDTDTPARWRLVMLTKIAGIHRRIVHSHSTSSENQRNANVSKLVMALRRMMMRLFATDYLACSEDAGVYMFGRSAIRSRKFHVVKNGIDIENYRFSPEIRKTVRDREGVNDEITVLGFVGRLVEVKNIPFLLNVFREYHKRNEHSVLWIIGDGPLKEELQKTVCEQSLEESVRFFGKRNDVPQLMQGMDLFLVTSEFEGFSLVAVEAQTSGLPVYASTGVPKEANLTPEFHALDVKEGAEKWADRMVLDMRGAQRQDRSDEVRAQGYHIKETAEWMLAFYQKRKEMRI